MHHKDRYLVDLINKFKFEEAIDLLQNDIDLEQRDADGYTALHLSAMYGHSELLLALIEKGADITATCADGLNVEAIAKLNQDNESTDRILSCLSLVDRTRSVSETSSRHPRYESLDQSGF